MSEQPQPSLKYPSWCCQRCGEMIGWIGRVLLPLGLHKCSTKKEANTSEPDRTITIALSSDDDRLRRAEALCEIAFSDFVNPDRHGLLARAVLRVANALRVYEKLDAEAARQESMEAAEADL